MQKLSKALTFIGTLLALAFCTVSCKTDDDDEPTMYTVTVSDSIEHGKVTADKSSAEAGATVKLTATADSGYELDSYSVKDEKSNTITVTEGTFTMPKSNVTVSATFKETAVTPQKTAGSISYATATVSKTTDDEPFTNELTKTGDGTVTYASSKETVATVNEDGEVTIKGAGETTITATVADSDTYTYATKTASYTLTVTYIGTKAPSEAKAVGDIVFTDGSATPYSADLTLTDAQKAAAIAVIFDATKKLGVGLVQGSRLEWAKSGKAGYTTSIATLLATKTGGGDASDAEFSGDGASDGSGSLEKFRTAVSAGTDALSSDDYPAWAWIEGYAATANLTGTSYESGWYMPSIGELCALWKAKDAVNNSIGKIGGTQMSASYYWSSSQGADYSHYAWLVHFGWWAELSNVNKDATLSVCAVRAFN